MPLLYSNYIDLDMNRLNAAKKKIFKYSVDQYTRVGDIQSNIQPTQSQMNEYFLRITTVLNQLIQQLRSVINGAESDRVALEFGSIITEFSNEFILKIFPVYNYFNPQQNQQIIQLIIKIQDIFEEILFGNYGQVIDNFIETTR